MTFDLQTRARRFPTPAPEADGTLQWDHTTAVTVTVGRHGFHGTGWTYGHAAACDVIDTILRTALDDADEADPPMCWQAMIDACRNIGATGLVMQAISAVDIALWDLHARTLGVSLPHLWGQLRFGVPVYGSGGFVTDDDAALRQQIDDWSRLGCRGMKIKIGEDRGTAVARDLARVQTLTELAPAGTACMVDANGAYTTGQAIRVGRELDQLGIVWFEEPVTSDDPSGLRRVRDSVTCDVAAGEYIWRIDDADRTAEVVDCLQLDVTRCGGYTGWFRAAAVAAARHLEVSAHCAPALHAPVAVATPNIRHIEYFIDHARLEPTLAVGVPVVREGMLRPNTAPGHGMTLA